MASSVFPTTFSLPHPPLVPTCTSKKERDRKGNEDESSLKGFDWPQHSRGCTCLGNVSFVPPAC